MKKRIIFCFFLILFFVAGCTTVSGDNWKKNIVSDMESDIEKTSDVFVKKEKAESLVPIFELLDGGKTVKVILKGLYLVPKDNTKTTPFLPAKVRIVSLFKERGGYKTKFLSEGEVVNGAISITIPNPAHKFGEPFVDGWWGMGIGVNTEAGYLMINPDNDFTSYKTTTFGGYKTMSGDRADMNTLLICPVFYKDKVRPLKEVLAEQDMKINDFYHGGTKWGYCPELANK